MASCVLKILEVDQEVPGFFRLEFPRRNEVASLDDEVVSICSVKQALVGQLTKADDDEGAALSAYEFSHRCRF